MLAQVAEQVSEFDGDGVVGGELAERAFSILDRFADAGDVAGDVRSVVEDQV